jgi:hypothetical protein
VNLQGQKGHQGDHESFVLLVSFHLPESYSDCGSPLSGR